ncbi:hypothetical protein KIF53_13250 [Chromobacterium subtsugae]|uniref:Cell surface protein n=1 Tax=Chromobacterium subtsugae TaxID=251747 RepID=A0ABS7FGJ4_9NEIS|nr:MULTISPECIES: hypothetical protein [Chromobacterium]KUM03532.1 hypothetical protein Cv017_19390 [Chromobacterium subtsugae]KZE87550.1 hypothetical protein AWB61_10185 [Chromobacterium sp. F49]MBW7567086.1 hypothetical protein [Chromobacterium subtsugae]MBW8288595.1 hypothetical protein [Chromobacterium subtsugae]WSE90178.1 hypothetical protein U6115_14910 [Chromobacterium subtsugae]
MKYTLIALACLVSLPAAAGNATNPDVKKFVDAADLCEHFLGEIGGPGSAKEQKQLVNKANRYCDVAKRQFKKVDAKYKTDKEVQTILDDYRDELED